MKVEVERDALMSAVRAVIDVVEARTTIPVLSNMLVEAEGGSLTLTGTDLDLQVSATVPAAGEMKTTVDARKLQAAVDSLSKGKVTIAPIDGRAAVTLKAGRGQRILPTLAATDFPKRGPITDARSFAIPGGDLSRILDTASVAMSTEETRYYLNGIYIHPWEGRLRGAATDGHRLVRVEVALPAGSDTMEGVILPRKAVGHLRKLLAKHDGTVDVEATTAAMSFQIGGVRVLTKLIEGTFPDYNRIIPEHAGRGFTCRPAVVAETVSAVTAVTAPEGEKMKVRSVVLAIASAPHESEARAKDQTGTSANEALDVEPVGAPIQFGVNRDYLRSLVALFRENGAMTLDIRDPAAPMKLTGEHDPDLVAIVMPMRV